MKNTKGITLIALIITIIILLILTGVTMNIAVNGGLFNNAQRAVDDTNAKVSSTQDRVDELSGILDDVASQSEEHNWSRTGINLKCSHCGLTLTIGDYLGYTPDVTSQTVTVTWEESGHIDRINQTFTQETGNYWKVLGIEDGDGNGTNETLLIKMVNPTEKTLILYGAAGYNNGEKILNKICKELYSSSKYGEARSIKIEDVSNCLQYTPVGGIYYDTSGEHQLNGFETPIKDLPTWEEIKANGTYTPDGTNTEEILGSYEVNGYNYFYDSMDDSIEQQYNEVITVFATISGEAAEYWLANSAVLVYHDEVQFGLGSVSYGFVDLPTFYLFSSEIRSGCERSI